VSILLDYSIVLDLAGKHWLFKRNRLRLLNSINEVKGPKVVVTDFGESLTRVDTIVGTRQYADAIIEKRLRDQGDTDGVSKVLIIDAETNSNTTRVLYTAVSAETFGTYWMLAAQDSDHCQLIPMASLMLRLAQSQGKGVHAVVLQYEQHIEMIITMDGRSQSSLRVSSSSMDDDDWQRAISYLAAEMKQAAITINQEIETVSWVDWNPLLSKEFNILSLSKKLTVALGQKVTTLHPESIAYDKHEMSSEMPTLLKMLKSKDAINSFSDKLFYYSELTLPWIAGIFLALSGALFASGVYWQQSAQNLQQQRANLLVDFDDSSLQSMQDKITIFRDKFDSRKKSDFEFVEKLQGAIHLPSIATLMNDVKASLPKGVKISLLALDVNKNDKAAAPIGYVVEGRILKSISDTNRDVEYMTQQLIKRGYHVQDNGLINKESNHIFQLLLTVGK
jgi:hypothetical protein